MYNLQAKQTTRRIYTNKHLPTSLRLSVCNSKLVQEIHRVGGEGLEVLVDESQKEMLRLLVC